MRNFFLPVACILIIGSVLLTDRLSPPKLDRFLSTGTQLLSEKGTILSALPAADTRWRFKADIDKLDPRFIRMLIDVEDKRFYQHHGVDFFSLLRAMGQLLMQGRVVSGASTLTMQTARLLEPRPRTIYAKMIEIFRAFQLEARFSKNQILQIYLTLAPYGGRIEGIEAASMLLFGHNPKILSPAEAALLITLPQSPEKRRPDRFPHRAQIARDNVLLRLFNNKVITAQDLKNAQDMPVTQTHYTFPHYARHLLERFNKDKKSDYLETSLDAQLMKDLSTMLFKSAQRLSPAVTISVLIAENQTSFVRAYVGNADYFNRNKLGMIDMIPAVRSPGSTLKPFIYGLAFDQRMAQPLTLIQDQSSTYQGYSPHNFDQKFSGEITIADALQRSRNLPAVAVLNRLGPQFFDTAVQNANILLHFNRNEGPASLPLALGGVGITLEDMVRLYAALAQNGHVASRLVYFTPKNAPSQPIQQHIFLKAESAYQIWHILYNSPKPAGLLSSSQAMPPVAFKTGTSYGQRDAWAFGVTEHYTIGVWVGRADGQPCSECVGIQTAAPILWQILPLLPQANQQKILLPPNTNIISARTTADLPLALQRFYTGHRTLNIHSALHSTSAKQTYSLALRYPYEGARLIFSQDDMSGLPLKATGGKRPLRWYVNGKLIPNDPLSSEAVWTRPEAGFSRISVIDSMGSIASVEIFIAKTPSTSQ